MRAILSIFFFVVFGLIGMRLSGPASKALIGLRTFQSPDDVAVFTLAVNIGVALAIALIGVAIGLVLAPSLQRKFIREEL
jgi:hypothetical protein